MNAYRDHEDFVMLKHQQVIYDWFVVSRVKILLKENL